MNLLRVPRHPLCDHPGTRGTRLGSPSDSAWCSEAIALAVDAAIQLSPCRGMR